MGRGREGGGRKPQKSRFLLAKKKNMLNTTDVSLLPFPSPPPPATLPFATAHAAKNYLRQTPDQTARHGEFATLGHM